MRTYIHFTVHIRSADQGDALAGYCQDNGLDYEYDAEPGDSETYCVECGQPINDHDGELCPNVRRA
jgi:hypothetical protein